MAIEEICQRCPSTPGTLASPSPCTPRTVDVKLPKLEMHSFDGNVTKWITFWDSFESAIDSSP